MCTNSVILSSTLKFWREWRCDGNGIKDNDGWRVLYALCKKHTTTTPPKGCALEVFVRQGGDQVWCWTVMWSVRQTKGWFKSTGKELVAYKYCGQSSCCTSTVGGTSIERSMSFWGLASLVTRVSGMTSTRMRTQKITIRMTYCVLYRSCYHTCTSRGAGILYPRSPMWLPLISSNHSVVMASTHNLWYVSLTRIRY